MRQARLLASGVMINWTAYAVAIVAGFFVSPFIVHRLGNVAYGVWVLATSAVGYMAFVDLGLRGAVMHFVAKHRARGEHIESSQAVSVALGFRVLISLAVTLASLILAALATRIFRIPVEMWAAARWAVIITGFNLSLTLISGVFGGVLAALQRFDLASGLAIAQTLASTAGMVWVVWAGYGIIALVGVQFAVSAVVGLATVALCFRVYPELRIGVNLVERNVFRDLWGFSFYLFVINITGQIIYFTDNLVVGAFLSAAAVTFYSIGGRLVRYLGELGATITQTFMPFAANFGAQGREDQLRRLLVQGTRVALLLSLPVGAALFVRGPTFIGLWMGPQYAQPSGRILRILLLSMLAIAGNRTAGNIVFGLGKHKPFALWQTCEAVANLSLSIYLARRIGMEGVAWGTAFPSLVSQLLIWPRYISKLLNMRVRSYFWEGWIRPALATTPFCLACIGSEHYWAARGLVHFFFQIAILLPMFPLGVALLFWKELRWQLRSEDSLLRSVIYSKLQRGAAS